MVRIGVISDSHRDYRRVEQVKQKLGQLDWLIHAGDHLQDAAEIARRLGVELARVRAVVGNCDYPLTDPVEDVWDIEGVRLLITHGHMYSVKRTLDRICYRAQEAGARVAIFGHSHVAINVEDRGVLLFNPGSISAPHLPQDPPSCGLLEVDAGRLQATIVPLDF